MSKIFFTSDLHFGHENVLRFDSRPFATVEEMDSELIRRWNAKVGRGDLVYVLGDMIPMSQRLHIPSSLKSSLYAKICSITTTTQSLCPARISNEQKPSVVL